MNSNNLLIIFFVVLCNSLSICFKYNKYNSFISKLKTCSILMQSNDDKINFEDIKISEIERKDLWKSISSLEKEAIQLLTTQSDKNVDEAYKLFIKSTSLKSKDPFLSLSSLYSKALEEQNIEKSEEIFSAMKDIGVPPHITSMLTQIKTQQSKPLDESNLIIAAEEVDTGSTFSDTVTEKIRVKVNSFYDKEKSDPTNGKYMFWYKVAVCNEGVEPVQIVARMWEIEKCKGEKEVVRGAGVMSTQPIVAPGETFTYTSACPLKVFPPKGKRVLGSMSGAYTMCKGNMGQHNFTVKISKFNLILPADVIEKSEDI